LSTIFQVLNVITILVTVIIINVYFRGPTTHRMPVWVRTAFLDVMPKLLCMQRPKQQYSSSAVRNYPLIVNNGTVVALPGIGALNIERNVHHPFCPSSTNTGAPSTHVVWPPQPPAIELTHVDAIRPVVESDPLTSAYYPLTAEAVRAVDAIEYITDHLKQDEEFKGVCVHISDK
jgi:hypothetical protein